LAIASSTRRSNGLSFDFRCFTILGNFLIEAEISRGGTGDEPRSTAESQVFDGPLEENQKSIQFRMFCDWPTNMAALAPGNKLAYFSTKKVAHMKCGSI